jgi:hypothetical protein
MNASLRTQTLKQRSECCNHVQQKCLHSLRPQVIFASLHTQLHNQQADGHARGRLWTSDRPTRSNQAVMRNPSLFINAHYPKLLFNACMSCVKKSGGYRAKEGYRRRKSEMQRCIGASDPVTSFGVRSARGTRCLCYELA